ncbi:MAG TPA: hypothetical protein VII06_11835 [Chloroflexota bacterium]|jgi:hypothetical protein
MDEYELSPALVWGLIAFAALVIVICAVMIAVPMLTTPPMH